MSPRCNCGTRCSCLIEAGDGVTVSGVGTSAQPYVISSGGGGGGPVFQTLAGITVGQFPQSIIYGAGSAFTDAPGEGFAIAPGTSVPFNVVAGTNVVSFFQNIILQASRTWNVQWDAYVTNQVGTEVLHVGVFIASPGVGVVPTPPAAGWSTVYSLGSDLSLVDNVGEAHIISTAGGVYSVQYYFAGISA